jgi:hypothetical protein
VFLQYSITFLIILITLAGLFLLDNLIKKRQATSSGTTWRIITGSLELIIAILAFIWIKEHPTNILIKIGIGILAVAGIGEIIIGLLNSISKLHPISESKSKKEGHQLLRTDKIATSSEGDNISNRYLTSYLLVIALCIIVLSPMINSGFISDDALRSLLKGQLLESRQNLPPYIYNDIKNWMIFNGRFIPAAFLIDAFLFVSNLFLYKISMLTIVIVNVVLFAYLIKLLTNSGAISLLAISGLPLFFQFRLYHDPILSFGWGQGMIFVYTFVSLIFLVKYLKTEKKLYLIISAFFYLVDLMTSEMTYIFFPFHLLIIYFLSGKNKIRNIIKVGSPFILAVIIISGISLYLRLAFHQGYEGTKISYNLVPYFATLTKQSFAAVPLSYFIVDPHKIFTDKFIFLKGNVALYPMLFAICYFVLFVNISNEIKKERLPVAKKNIILILILGILIIVLPGGIVSLSSKYQGEIGWGIGYLPVYISYYGLSLIVSTFIYLVIYKLINNHRIMPKVICTMFAIICGVLGTINYNNNIITVAKTNYSFLYPRTIIEEGIKNGLFQTVPNDSYLVAENDYDLNAVQGGWDFYRWDSPAFYRMHSGIHFKDVLSKGRFLKKEFLSQFAATNHDKSASVDFSKADNVFFLNYSSHSNSEGYAIAGKIRNYSGNNDEIGQAISDEAVYLYVRFPLNYPQEKITIKGGSIDNNRVDISEPFSMDNNSLKIINYGSNWRLYALSHANSIDLKSLKVAYQ